MGQAPTALALQKRVPPFYPDNRQEEYGKIVIHPSAQGLVEAARRTSPRMAILRHSFGLDTGNEKKHGLF
jgi:hypothetical protein